MRGEKDPKGKAVDDEPPNEVGTEVSDGTMPALDEMLALADQIN